MENTQWAYENLRSVHLELSTLCNSICPWCPRYVDFSPNVNPNIVKKITKATLYKLGSMYWHSLAGSTVFPVQISVNLFLIHL